MFRLTALPALLLAALPLAAQDSLPPPSVTVAEVALAEVIDRVPVAGTLVSRDEVLVTPLVSGYPIEALLHDIGDSVEAGEVLARLDDRTLAAQLAQADAELARARAAVGQAQSQIDSAAANADQTASARTRTQTLRDSGTTTQAVLDQAVASDLTSQAALRTAQDGLAVSEAQVQQAEAARDIAELNLSHAIIRAPVAGIISERAGRIGAMASGSGDPLYRIIADGTVELEAEVIETDLGRIERGDAATIAIAGLATVPGTVRLIPPTVNPLNRLGTVRVTLEAEGLRPGLFASGWIVVTRRDAPTVPTAAVLSDAAGDYVLIVEEGTLSRRDVIAGLIWDGRREIVEGVEPGQVVVARAGGFFAAGDNVTPVEATSEDAPGGDQAAESGR